MPLGIDNNEQDIFKIYPNPATNLVQLKHSEKIISYRITDYTGKQLMADNYLETGISIGHLVSGIYIVQILLENKTQAFGKLVIEK